MFTTYSLVKNPLISTLFNHLVAYPTPTAITYLWGFGSLAGLVLVNQIVSGVLLAMHYVSEIHLAFSAVEHIMRDVVNGTALRYIHANGASFFFIVVYIHIFRGLYFGSYTLPRTLLWYSGVVIFILMMATAFLGYVLPWGQMSLWGATVITNLFSAIPQVGTSIVELLWGGFSVANPTLNRFFSLHYLLPFLIAAVVIVHLVLLHIPGSNNPLSLAANLDKIRFYPYFYVKDLFGLMILLLGFAFFVAFAPNYLGHPDNYIEANPLVTPAHIVPEWYFLPFYAILRTIPDKLGGVVLMFVAIIILLLLPILDLTPVKSNLFNALRKWSFWFFAFNGVVLGWVGQEIVESPFIETSTFVSLVYFLYFLAIKPINGAVEQIVTSIFFRIGGYTTSNSLSGRNFDLIAKYGEGKLDAKDLIDINNPEVIAAAVKATNKGFLKFTSNWISTWWDSFFYTNVVVFQIVFVGLFVLFLSFFFAKTGLFTKFLNRLSAFYLLFIAVVFKTSIVPYKFSSNPEALRGFVYKQQLDLEWPLTKLSAPFANVADYLEAYKTLLFKLNFDVKFISDPNDDFGYIFEKDWMKFYNHHWNEITETLVKGYTGTFHSNILFREMFYFYILILFVLFFYGVSDRFFIRNSKESEFPILLFSLQISSIILLFSNTFLEFLLAIEIITLGSYVLTAYERTNRFSAYAGVQYFILGSLPSGLLFLSVALLYKIWGSITYNELSWLTTAPVTSKTFSHDFYVSHLFEKLVYWMTPYEYPFQHMRFYDDYNTFFFVKDLSVAQRLEDIVTQKNVAWRGKMVTSIMGPNWIIDPYVWHKKFQVRLAFDAYMSYTDTKSLQFIDAFKNLYADLPDLELLIALTYNYSSVTIFAILLILFNLFFKLTVSPFHFWAPSVYGKAPLASVTFLSIFSKCVVIFVLFKLLFFVFAGYKMFVIPFIIFCSLLTVLSGMIGAFSENVIKRFFVYSSMGHVTYMLVALAISTFEGVSSSFQYLPIYIITSFVMWFVVLQMGRTKNHIAHFSILKVKDPILGLYFAALIFSMSGIPPLGGFFIKLDVLYALMDSSRFFITFVLLLATVPTFFYYLRVLKVMYFDRLKRLNTLPRTKVIGEERLWLIVILTSFLVFYLFFVEKSLTHVQTECLLSPLNQITGISDTAKMLKDFPLSDNGSKGILRFYMPQTPVRIDKGETLSWLKDL